MWSLFQVADTKELINVKYLNQASYFLGVHRFMQYLSDTVAQVTRHLDKHKGIECCHCCLCRHSSPLFANSELSSAEPLTDPAIWAEKRRWPHKQIKTVLTDGSCVWEIICLFCIFSEWLQTGFFWARDVRVGVLVTLLRALMILTSRCPATELWRFYCKEA